MASFSQEVGDKAELQFPPTKKRQIQTADPKVLPAKQKCFSFFFFLEVFFKTNNTVCFEIEVSIRSLSSTGSKSNLPASLLKLFSLASSLPLAKGSMGPRSLSPEPWSLEPLAPILYPYLANHQFLFIFLYISHNSMPSTLSAWPALCSGLFISLHPMTTTDRYAVDFKPTVPSTFT